MQTFKNCFTPETAPHGRADFRVPCYDCVQLQVDGDSGNNQFVYVESHLVESCAGGYSPTISRIGTGPESAPGSLRPPGFTATTRTCSRSPAVRFLMQ